MLCYRDQEGDNTFRLEKSFPYFHKFFKVPRFLTGETFCLPYSSLVLKRFDFGLTLENAFCHLLHRHQNDQNSLQPQFVNPQGTKPKNEPAGRECDHKSTITVHSTLTHGAVR